MTRIIKFRAWSEETKVMSEPFSLLNALKRECVNTPHWGKGIFMQFTGLLDKNGKEIYEGDILRYNYHIGHQSIDFKGEVLYKIGEKESSDTSFRYVGFILRAVDDGEYWYADIPHTLDDIEIIGNIYENPELLSTNIKA